MNGRVVGIQQEEGARRCESEWTEEEAGREGAADGAMTEQDQQQRHCQQRREDEDNNKNENGRVVNVPVAEIMRAVGNERSTQNCEHSQNSTCSASSVATRHVVTGRNPTRLTGSTWDASSVATQQVVTNTNLTRRTGLRTNATVDVNMTAEPSTETTAVVANATVTTGTAEATVESYWEPRPTSRAEDLKLFLHLFKAASGALSKRKPKQWEFIRNRILPKLSEVAFVAKEQEN